MFKKFSISLILLTGLFLLMPSKIFADDNQLVLTNNPSGQVEPGTVIDYQISGCKLDCHPFPDEKVMLFVEWSDPEGVAEFVEGSASPDVVGSKVLAWEMAQENDIVEFQLKFHESHDKAGTFPLNVRAYLKKIEADISQVELCATSNIVSNSVTFGGELAIEKSVNPQQVNPGEETEFTVTVSNSGNMIAKNVEVRDMLPIGFAYVMGSAKLNNETLSDPNVISDNEFSWQIGDLGVGEQNVVSFKAMVSEEQDPGKYTNNVFVTAENITDEPSASVEIEVLTKEILGEGIGGGAEEALPLTGAETIPGWILMTIAPIALGGVLSLVLRKY